MFRTTIASVMLFTAFATSTTVNAATHPEIQDKQAAHTVSAKATEGAEIVVARKKNCCRNNGGNRRVQIKRPKR